MATNCFVIYGCCSANSVVEAAAFHVGAAWTVALGPGAVPPRVCTINAAVAADFLGLNAVAQGAAPQPVKVIMLSTSTPEEDPPDNAAKLRRYVRAASQASPVTAREGAVATMLGHVTAAFAVAGVAAKRLRKDAFISFGAVEPVAARMSPNDALDEEDPGCTEFFSPDVDSGLPAWAATVLADPAFAAPPPPPPPPPAAAAAAPALAATTAATASAPPATQAPVGANAPTVDILFGSAGGESLVGDVVAALSAAMTERGVLCTAQTLNAAAVKDTFDLGAAGDMAAAERCAIVVCDSAEDDDLPDNATRFRRYLKNAARAAPWAHIQVCFIEVGGAAAKLRKPLEESGAKMLVPPLRLPCDVSADTLVPAARDAALHFIAAMEAARPAPSDAVPSATESAASLVATPSVDLTPAVRIWYASQSGNSEIIARNIHKQLLQGTAGDGGVSAGLAALARAFGVPIGSAARLVAAPETLNEVVKRGLLNSDTPPTRDIIVIIVCSTHGDGEIPDNGLRFKKYVRTLRPQSLGWVHYALLALGDTNYTHFCAAGRLLDAEMVGHGAQRFYGTGLADDGIGLELVVDPWVTGLDAALCRVAGAKGFNPLPGGGPVATIAQTSASAPQDPIVAVAPAGVVRIAFTPRGAALALQLQSVVVELGLFPRGTLPALVPLRALLESEERDHVTWLFVVVADPWWSEWPTAHSVVALRAAGVAVYLDPSVPAPPAGFQPLARLIAPPTAAVTVNGAGDEFGQWLRQALHRPAQAFRSQADIPLAVDNALSGHRSMNPRQTRGAVAETAASSRAALTPCVIMYSSAQRVTGTDGGGVGVSVASDVALQMERTAKRDHNLACAAIDIAGFKSAGFPRRALFILVIGPGLTKGLQKLLRELRTMPDSRLQGLHFALLCIESSHAARPFAHILELESLLLRGGAAKIHRTGLALAGEADAVVQPWLEALWPAVEVRLPVDGYVEPQGWVARARGRTRVGHTAPASAAGTPMIRPATHDGGAHEAEADLLHEPWLRLPVVPAAAKQSTRVTFLHRGAGLSITFARRAAEDARAQGYSDVVVASYADNAVEVSRCACVVFFCEPASNGRLARGRELLQELRRGMHRCDWLSHVAFTCLAIGSPDDAVAPARHLATKLCASGASRTFPLGVVDSVSAFESAGLRWCRGALASFAVACSRHAAIESAAAVQPDVRAAVAAAPSASRSMLFLYGSTSGTSESIARDMHQQAVALGFLSRVGPLREYDAFGLQQAAFLCVVCSTAPGGEVPRNAEKFTRFLTRRSRTAGDLHPNVRYAVLGLGDRTLHAGDAFCAPSRNIDEKLASFGATRLAPIVQVDYAENNLTPIVAAWRSEFFRSAVAAVAQGVSVETQPPCVTPAVAPAISASPYATPAAASDALAASRASAAGLLLDEDAPVQFTARLEDWFQMTTGGAQPVIHCTFAFTSEPVLWTPGDAISLMPLNDEAEVDEILRALAVDPVAPFVPPPASDATAAIYHRISLPVQHRDLLLRHVTLRAHKPVLELLMMHTSDPAQREALRAQASMSTASSAAPALIDVLRGASSCRPPFRALVETLRPLQPRYYSLASAALHDPQRFSFAFRLVSPRGVCTSWLRRLCDAQARGEEVVLQVGLRTAPEFRLPPSDATPIVMIGPGTGVTPFISFLEHRLALLAQPEAAGRTLGEAHLFFGAKNSAEDFLFEEELEYFCEHGALQQLHTAFSQEASGGNWFGGFYVQDRLWEFGLHLAALMRDHGAHVYVCGDAQSMAQDVHRVLLEVLVEYGGMVVEQARAYLADMQKTGRYQRDIWG